jgi:GTP pyrophosphokinase
MNHKKQVLIARETLDVYVPLADYLGIKLLKHPLEQLAFQALDPQVYMSMLDLVQRRQHLNQHTPFYLQQQAVVISRKLRGYPSLRHLIKSIGLSLKFLLIRA